MPGCGVATTGRVLINRPICRSIPASFGGPPGDGGAEDHGVLAGVALQQQRPGCLHQGIEGHCVPLGECLQARGACRRQAALELAPADLLALGGDRLGQAGRLQQFRQLLFPERLAGALVLRL